MLDAPRYCRRALPSGLCLSGPTTGGVRRFFADINGSRSPRGAEGPAGELPQLQLRREAAGQYNWAMITLGSPADPSERGAVVEERSCPVCRSPLKPKVIIPWLLRRLPTVCPSCGARLGYDKTGGAYAVSEEEG